MPTKPTDAAARKPKGAGPESVESFLAALDHPRKQEILTLRQLILDADPTIEEGIKWNAPSFRTSEYFATFHLRATEGVQLILHLGARKRDIPAGGIAIDDPDALLEWLGKDRATVKLGDAAEIEARRGALTAVIRDWIRHV